MTDADHFFLPREHQRAVVTILRKIPDLVEDLAISITRQDRVALNGPRVSRGERVQPLLFNVNSSEAADALHHELARWARFVCEERGIEYWPVGYTHRPGFVGPLLPRERRLPAAYRESTIGLARWLDRYIVALAMTEGAETALDEIRDAYDVAWRATNAPRERARPPIDLEQHERARRTELHRDAIEKAARELGEKYSGLTAKRVDTLRRRNKIQAVRCLVASRAEIFVLGDVLDAHLAYPTRARRIEA